MKTPLSPSVWGPPAALALAACGVLFALSQRPAASAGAVSGNRSPALPLFFVASHGRPDSAARFSLRGAGFRADFLGGQLLYASGARRWRTSFLGTRPQAFPAAGDPLEARLNYLAGQEPGQWLADLPAYSSIIYREIYPGIDLVYRVRDDALKADFHIRPGGQLSSIRWRYEGVERARIEPDGALVVWTGSGTLREEPPQIYQVLGGARRAVRGGYRKLNEMEFGFWVEDYDPRAELVIDPVLSYSTLAGGSGSEVVRAAAADAAGNLYLAGYTDSANFPVSNALQSARAGGVEAFVAKLSPSGRLIYCTYLGGSGDDRAFGLAVDGAGSAYVTGWTYSSNFPVTNAVPQRTLRGGRDAFLTKLSPAGNSLVYSTYLGGAGHDSANAIAVDTSGNAVVAGDTYSSDFPAAYPFQSANGGRQDAFVAKLNPAGTALVWSTYLGGAGDDRANGVAVDASGAVYVTGGTFSTNFPVWQALRSSNAGGQDAFVTKLSSDGRNLVYSTYLGGSSGSVTANEAGMAVQVDAAGNAYVAGMTSSVNFPVANALRPAPAGGGMDAFLTKLNPSGASLVYSTYLGGSSQDYALALAVAPSGLAAVAGYTSSADFPVRDALQGVKSGGYDAFVARLRPDGSALEVSTYWGGSDSDAAYAVAMDRAGNLWIAGQTLSPDYPLLRAFQSSDPGSGSAFAARIVDRTPVAAFRGADGSPRLTLYGSTLLPNAGGNIGSEVAVWQNGIGDVYIAGSNASSCVYLNTYRLTTHSWTGWLRAGCGLAGAPAVVASDTGEVWIIARDAGYTYYLSRYLPGSGFTAWLNLGAGFTTDPVAALSKDGTVYVAGRKNDGRVYAGRWTSAGFQGWVAGSAGPLVDGRPAITCGSDGAAYVAVRAPDRTTWIARHQGSSWGTWYSAGGTAYGGPDAAASGGLIYVTVTNINGLVYVRPFAEGTGNGWQAWINTAGNLKRPSIAGANGRFYIAGRALDNNLWWFEGNVGWTPMGNAALTGGELNAGPH